MSHIVYIIESPEDKDLLVGRQEASALQHALQLAGIKCQVYLTVSPQCFVLALQKIALDSAQELKPIIHLSAHGTKEGICLTNGTLYPWAVLRKVFTKVNEALGGALLLCMSTCSGYSAKAMIADEAKEPAFHTLVGSKEDVAWSTALVAFVTFYHLVISCEIEPEEAVPTMNLAAGLPEKTFRVTTSAKQKEFYQKRAHDKAKVEALIKYLDSLENEKN